MPLNATITLCTATYCPHRHLCYRGVHADLYRGVHGQRFADFLYGKVECEAYIPKGDVRAAPATPPKLKSELPPAVEPERIVEQPAPELPVAPAPVSMPVPVAQADLFGAPGNVVQFPQKRVASR